MKNTLLYWSFKLPFVWRSVCNSKLNTETIHQWCDCLHLISGLINLIKSDRCIFVIRIVVAVDVEFSHNSVCLGNVYGVIGKIQIMSGIAVCIFFILFFILLHLFGFASCLLKFPQRLQE